MSFSFCIECDTRVLSCIACDTRRVVARPDARILDTTRTRVMAISVALFDAALPAVVFLQLFSDFVYIGMF